MIVSIEMIDTVDTIDTIETIIAIGTIEDERKCKIILHNQHLN